MTSFPVRVAVRRSNAAFILAMCLTIVCHAVAAHGRDWDKLRDGIRRLRMELARQELHAFVTNRTTTPRVAHAAEIVYNIRREVERSHQA